MSVFQRCQVRTTYALSIRTNWTGTETRWNGVLAISSCTGETRMKKKGHLYEHWVPLMPKHNEKTQKLTRNDSLLQLIRFKARQNFVQGTGIKPSSLHALPTRLLTHTSPSAPDLNFKVSRCWDQLSATLITSENLDELSKVEPPKAV